MQYADTEHCAKLARMLAEVIEGPDATADEIALAFDALHAAVADYAVDPRLGPLVRPARRPPCDDIDEWHPADVRHEFPVTVN
jgi:hypothetical protein